MSNGNDKQSTQMQQHGGLVSFGKFMSIDSSRRLPQFDNGTSLAYQAFDNRDKSKKFIAIVADTGLLPRWTSCSAYDGLGNTTLIHLVGSGVLRWPLTGKQHYVFLYKGGLGDCLVKQGEISKISWRHPDIVKFLIAPIIRLLKDMSDKNISHGSIRPSNIFYAGIDKNQPVIIGDCLSVQPHSTQPSIFLPIDKALADPLGRGRCYISDDLYAFGVSLAMFLRRNDELSGLSDKDILQRKIELGSYTAIVGAERYQASFLELLRGLLHDDVKMRWGLDDVFSWLDGSRMTPPALSRRKKANRPFIFNGRKYLFPDILAMDLQENPMETAKIIKGQELSQWIEKSLADKEIEENYNKALERCVSAGDNKDFIVAQVSMALNPMLPIYYKGLNFTYDGIGGLMAQAAYKGESLSIFKEILLQNLPDHSLSLKSLSQNEVLLQIKLFDSCRASIRLKSQGHGIEKCIYMLSNDAPCFSPKFQEYFVYNDKSALITFENLSKKGKEVALFLDSHCIAFFTTHNSRLMERVIYDLNSSDKDKKIAGNLRFMAAVQQRTKIDSLPAIANVFLGSLSGVYKIYNNVKLRKQIEEGVKLEAKKGNLIGMSSFIDNQTLRNKDQKAFELAKREYALLQDEYNQYNRKLANKKTYGVVNGHDAAAVVSWIIATAITVMSVIAFLSGYRIF